MLLIHCPYCGEERPELEFRHAGEAHIARSASITEVGDEDFEAFLYLRTNTKGLVYERWRHVHGCGRFFNAVRDSVTDRFLTTYKAGMPKPDAARFAKVAAVEPPVAEPAIPVAVAKPKPAAPARAPRKPPSARALTAEPASEKPVAAKPARARAKPAEAPDAAPVVEQAPKRTVSKPAKPATTSAKVSAGKTDKPAEAGKPTPTPGRARSAPVKKGEA